VTSDGLIDAQTDAPALYERYVEAGRSDEAAEEVRDAVVTDEEIRDLVLGSDSLDDAASGLIDLSNDRGGKDNLSVIFARDPRSRRRRARTRGCRSVLSTRTTPSRTARP